MNAGKILILNLAKGRIGETPAQLLGSLFVIAFAQAAEERANKRPCHGDAARRALGICVRRN
jgi:hypothetical protein